MTQATSRTKRTRTQISNSQTDKENLIPDSKRVQKAAKRHLERVDSAHQRGVRPPQTTILSTPKGTRVVSKLNASVILSPNSGNQLFSPSKQQRHYTWSSQEGEPFYHGITSQVAVKRVLAQEFCSTERMSPAFTEALEKGVVRLHIEKSGVDRSETLWQETCRILDDLPAANRSIIPPWGDGYRLTAFLRKNPDKVAILKDKLEKLRQEPSHPFPSWSVRRLARLVNSLQQP